MNKICTLALLPFGTCEFLGEDKAGFWPSSAKWCNFPYNNLPPQKASQMFTLGPLAWKIGGPYFWPSPTHGPFGCVFPSLGIWAQPTFWQQCCFPWRSRQSLTPQKTTTRVTPNFQNGNVDGLEAIFAKKEILAQPTETEAPSFDHRRIAINI